MSSPSETYGEFVSQIDLKAGFVYVAFMQESPEYGALVRDGLTGREHVNDEIAADAIGGGSNGGGFLSKISFARHAMAKVVQSFTAHLRFMHCEVVFQPSETGKKRHGPDKLLAVFVNSNENVDMKWRKFNQKYVWFNLRATSDDIINMLKFACKTRGEPYSAELRNKTATFPGNENRPGWYCSKHVATMLRALPCEMFHLNRTNTITVDELYHMIDQCGHKVSPEFCKNPPIVYENMYGREAVNEILYAKNAEIRN